MCIYVGAALNVLLFCPSQHDLIPMKESKQSSPDIQCDVCREHSERQLYECPICDDPGYIVCSACCGCVKRKKSTTLSGINKP